MKHQIFQAVERSPIIAAIKNDQGLEKVISEDSKVVFVLYGDLMHIADIVRRIHEAGKYAIVHADLISGLGSREIAVDYVKTSVKADGIISTRPAFIRRGKELGLFTVLRFFVFDSLSLENVQKTTAAVQPDVVEILPGIMPKIIRHIASRLHVPLISGGLIMDKSDVMEALAAGAVGVSSTNESVWCL